MSRRAIRLEVLRDVVADAGSVFATRDISDDARVRNAHPQLAEHRNYHAFVGGALSDHHLSLNIVEVQESTPRGSQWRKQNDQEAWQSYERGLLERLRYEFPRPAFRVCGTIDEQQHRVMGRLSLSRRQLDVAVYRGGQERPFLIADAKRHARVLDVTDIESLIGLMDDVGASIGALVAPKGFSSAAARRAKSTSVRVVIMSVDEALTYRWYNVASEVYPYDWVFHHQLALSIRRLNDGADPDVIAEAMEEMAFEECEAFLYYALDHDRAQAVSFLEWIALQHNDDGWVYNAARILAEARMLSDDIRRELLAREDTDLRELLDDSQ